MRVADLGDQKFRIADVALAEARVRERMVRDHVPFAHHPLHRGRMLPHACADHEERCSHLIARKRVQQVVRKLRWPVVERECELARSDKSGVIDVVRLEVSICRFDLRRRKRYENQHEHGRGNGRCNERQCLHEHFVSFPSPSTGVVSPQRAATLKRKLILLQLHRGMALKTGPKLPR